MNENVTLSAVLRVERAPISKPKILHRFVDRSPARNFVTESRRYDVSPRNKYASLNVFLRFYAFWLHSMTVNRDIRISIAVRSLPARFGNLWAAFWVLSFYSISILIIIVFGEFFMLGERKFLSF